MKEQLEMLDQAEVHFRNHRFIEGADLVCKASFQAITQTAQAMNMPCNNKKEIYDFAKYLDRNHPNPEIRYITTILHAGVYPEYAATQHEPDENQWEPYEYIHYLHGHRQMVTALHNITQEKAALIA